MTVTKRFGVPMILALGLAGCADTSERLIVDGPKAANFDSDLAACEQVSMQRSRGNDGTIGGAVVGGLLGGVSADKGEGAEGAIAGALVGAAMGRVEDSADADAAREKIVFNCMRGRGHNVVG